MLDEYLAQIEQVSSEGAVVLLKWDGERTSKRCTVVVTRQDTDYVWRRDCEDIAATLNEALAEYRANHSH